MRIAHYLVIVFLTTFDAFSQNMVNNPTFDFTHSCPTGTGVFAGYDPVANCVSWKRGTPGSAEYFHKCNDENIGVPVNVFGYQETDTDSGYFGIISYSHNFLNYREYVEGELTPLVEGQTYNVDIKVSLAEYSNYACQGLGVLFYKEHPGFDTLHGGSTISFDPQITYNPYGVISDSLNWVCLSASFVADSAYTHLIIGNFEDDINTNPTYIGGDTITSEELAYYYIDQVSVSSSGGLCENSSVYDDVETRMQIYPNPGSGIFTIKNYNGERVDVFDSSGQKVFNANKAQINLSFLPKGLYFVKIVNSLDTQLVKIVIQ